MSITIEYTSHILGDNVLNTIESSEIVNNINNNNSTNNRENIIPFNFFLKYNRRKCINISNKNISGILDDYA